MKNLILLLIVASSCQTSSTSGLSVSNQLEKDENMIFANNDSIDVDSEENVVMHNYQNIIEFDDQSICGVRLGMKLENAIATLKKEYGNFEFVETSSNVWGFGGGTKSVLVRESNKDQFVLIPSSQNDKILFIVIIDSKYVNRSGLSTGLSVSQLLQKKNDLEFTINLMMGYEEAYFEDRVRLIFLTNDEKRIGKYEEIESFSKAFNLDPILDRIILDVL